MENYQGSTSSNQGINSPDVSPKSAQTIDAIRNVLYDIRGKLGYIMPNIGKELQSSKATSANHPLQRDLDNLLDLATELKNDINL
jgi:hypothetical protein